MMTQMDNVMFFKDYNITVYKRKLSIWPTTEYATANNKIFY